MGYILDIDKSFLIIQFLLESIGREARGKCFYKESVDELLSGVKIVESTLRTCQIPNKK
jgi:hypothetical protein